MAEPALSELREGQRPSVALPWDRPGGRAGRRPLALGVLPGSLVAALISLFGAAVALHLWRADLGVPLRYSPVDDTKFYLMLVKGIIDHGWFAANGSLGVPFGQQLYDFPQGADNLNLLLIRLLSVFSSNPAVVINLFYLATFALAGACGFAVLRAFGLATAASLVGSVLFSLLTYHFFRGESHLLLSAYYAVPLSCYLFLGLLDQRPLFARRNEPRPLVPAWVTRRTLTTVALCVVIGSESLYYATFAEVLLIAATGLALVLPARRRSAGAGAVVCALIAITLAINLAPSVAYRAQHGGNPAVERSAARDESHGLKLTNLVIPSPADRVGVLSRISATYDNAVAPGYCEACFASLGVVGSAGLGWLALCGMASLIGGAAWLGSRRLFRHSSVGVGVALVVASVGGLSSLVEFFITPDLRGWNRISVFVAFFSLLAVAVLLDALIGSARRRGGILRAWPAVVVAVAAFGAFEQTSDYFVPAYAADATEYRSDGAFVSAIQRRLPVGAGVFQLPYVAFPEGDESSPIGQPVTAFDLSYELTRGYIHSSTLRWSYGAMKGRDADWSAQLAAQPLSVVLASVAAAGFQGLWVDPNGYPTNAPQVRTALTRLVGAPPLLSPAGDLWFYDLRAFAARQNGAAGPGVAGLRHATLWPLRSGCSARGLALTNPSRVTRGATLRASLAGVGAAGVRVSFPDGAITTVAGGAVGGTGAISRHVDLPPGPSRVTVTPLGPVSGLQLSEVTLSDDALRRFTAGKGGGGASTDPVAGLVPAPCTLG